MQSEIKDNTSIHKNSKGMPKGIPFIIGNEAAERFSYYGMKAILTIFMVDYLNMTDSTSGEWFHNFNSAVYFLPIFGALLSDFVLGKYRTILWLSLIYCSGHLVLALYETQEGLLAGLSLIALGSGGIKPCVSAHVGDQFDETNKNLIPKIFNIFYFAINFGAFFSTLATPWLLDIYGPSIAFGIPGALMLIATFVFWLGRKQFVHIPAKPKEVIAELVKPEFLKTLAKLFVLYVFVAVFWSLFDQTGSSWVLQAKSSLMNKEMNFVFFSFEILPSQIGSANPILVLTLIPVFTFLIYPFVQKYINFVELKRVSVGFFIAAVSFFVLGYVEGQLHDGQEMSVWWQILAYLIITIAEILISITALEYSYSKAPNAVKSIIMSIYLFSVSLGNIITSQVNNFMVDEFEPHKMDYSNGYLTFKTDGLQFSDGDKLNITGDLGLIEKTSGESKTPIQGTYLVGDLGEQYVLWDINRKPLEVEISKKDNPSTIEKDPAKYFYYKLNGSAYFNFFAWLMLITAVLFIPVALKMKNKTYVQSGE